MLRIFEAQPEEEGGEERDEPAVAVLLVRRPLQAQVAAEDEPEQTERGKKEHRSRADGATPRDDWRRRFNDGGVQARER